MDLVFNFFNLDLSFIFANDSITIKIIFLCEALWKVIYCLIFDLSSHDVIKLIIFIVNTILKSKSSNRSTSFSFWVEVVKHLGTKLVSVFLLGLLKIVIKIIKAYHPIIFNQAKIRCFVDKFLFLTKTIYVLIITQAISIEIGKLIGLLDIRKIL